MACGLPPDLDDDAPVQVALVATAAPPRLAATTSTTRIFLWYADGNRPPAEGNPCEGQTPPAYTCGFADSIDECKRQIQQHLDAWYADFNVVFTFEKPSSGPYYTVVIASSGQWCGQERNVGGIAPINCLDMEGGTSYAFACGRDAKQCATIIAQEQAHMVGLAHTTSPADCMHPTVQPTSNGFEDVTSPVAGAQCRPTQNSYQLMLERLGRWPGGDKPDPFRAEDFTPLASAGGPGATRAPASVPPLEGPTEPGSAAVPDDGGGCDVAARGGRAGAFTLVALALAVWRQLSRATVPARARRRRRGR